MWQKTRSILAFIHDNYIDQYDYFHVAGDDTYVIDENLRNYLHLLEAMEGGRETRPLYVGGWIHFPKRVPSLGWEPPYNSGGPGYILNRLTLQQFVKRALPTCRREKDVFSGEDMNVARCLFQLDIFPIDTADAAHRQRFSDRSPQEIAEFVPTPDDIYQQTYEYWAKDHGWRVGMDLVSTQTVAFHHLTNATSMKRHHAIIYNSCPVGTILTDAMTNQL
jgi:glycoprotein-N-acetylgalactosamine 3-beta-galactosyltransferase